MKIETKFDEGDTVFYLLHHKIHTGIIRYPIETITNINLDGKRGKISTTVYCMIDNGVLPFVKHDMSYLFATKQELLDSL